MCRSSFRIPRIIVAPLAFAAWFLSTICSPAGFGQDTNGDSAKLVVTVDGEAVAPLRLDDVAHRAEDNRLLDVGVFLKLGAGREFHFTKSPGIGDLIYVTTPGQSQRLVGVRVTNWGADNEDAWVDQLSSLSNEEVRGLWGVEIHYWSDKIAEKLEQIDPDRTCISIDSEFEGTREVRDSPDRSLPAFPKELTNLVITSQSSEGISHFDELRNLTKLRSLHVGLGPRFSFDCSLIEGATQLEYLSLFDCPLKNTDALKTLTQLEILYCSYGTELTDLSFAKSMGKLKTLNIDSTQVTDLSPLGGLTELRNLNLVGTQVTDLGPLGDLANLREIDARDSRVSKLPAKMPNLRELNVIESNLNDVDVGAFQQQNPQCRVYRRWNQSLQLALDTVTRLRVRSGGSVWSRKFPETTLFESKNAAEIKQLIAGTVIDEAHECCAACFCPGSPSFEFYDGDKLLVRLSFHHGKSMRWGEVWPGDGILTHASGTFLVEWLANRGITGPLKEVQEKERRHRSDEKEIVRATNGLSPTLAKIIQSPEGNYPSALENFRSALNTEQPEPLQQVGTLLRLYGTSNEGWNSMPFIGRLAEDQLRTYGVETLASVVESALRGNDRQLRRGAVRFWKDRNSPPEKWDPEDIAELHRIVVLVEQEARYYPLRIDALTDIKRWKNDFTKEELDQRLTAGLFDPIPQVRRYAMIVAGKTMHKASIEVLMSVLKGNEIEPRPLPEVPLSESEDVSGGHPEYELACSDVDAASLALGYLNHVPAKPLIEAFKPRSAMRDVALALLGDGNQLKPEHFGTGNSLYEGSQRELQQEMELAAIQAVIRSKGRYGLKLALGYETVNKSMEERQIFDDICKMLRSENAPESDQLIHCHWNIELERWFDIHGAEYLKRFEGKP